MAGISKAEREALAAVKSKFDSIELTPEQLETVENVRKGFGKLAVELHRALPEGRNKSLAFTGLEDACMRAVRSVSHDGGEPAGQPADESASAAPVEAAAPPAEEKKTRKPRKRTAAPVAEAEDEPAVA